MCLSGSECDARGGVILGSCAQGFGSCCAVYISSCTSDNFRHNLTYIVSPGQSPIHCTALVPPRVTCPGYPGTYSAADTCTYTLPKASSGVCRIRLDFVEATLAAPSTQGACTTDYFTGTQVRGGIS